MSEQYPQRQPRWAAQPQQPQRGAPPQPGWTPPGPPKKRSVGKIFGLGCLGIFSLFIILGAIGSAIGGSSKTDAKTNVAKSSTTKVSSTPSPAKTAATGKPANTKTSAPKTVAITEPAQKVAPAAARKKAAAILEQEDQDFRDFLAQGESVVGTPQFTAWYQKAIVGLDMKQNAFKKADAYFTADNEPTDLLDAWRWDNGNGDGAISQFASDGTSPDAPDAATRKDASDCLADLAKADKDAEKIANSG
jgi:hypothetical protein